jgi:hypothetical protein
MVFELKLADPAQSLREESEACLLVRSQSDVVRIRRVDWLRDVGALL